MAELRNNILTWREPDWSCIPRNLTALRQPLAWLAISAIQISAAAVVAAFLYLFPRRATSRTWLTIEAIVFILGLAGSLITFLGTAATITLSPDGVKFVIGKTITQIDNDHLTQLQIVIDARHRARLNILFLDPAGEPMISSFGIPDDVDLSAIGDLFPGKVKLFDPHADPGRE